MLIVGRRINYNIYENMTIPNLPGLFDKFIEDIYTNSEFFMALAMVCDPILSIRNRTILLRQRTPLTTTWLL